MNFGFLICEFGGITTLRLAVWIRNDVYKCISTAPRAWGSVLCFRASPTLPGLPPFHSPISLHPESWCLGAKALPSVPAPHPAPWPSGLGPATDHNSRDLKIVYFLGTAGTVASRTMTGQRHPSQTPAHADRVPEPPVPPAADLSCRPSSQPSLESTQEEMRL